jgi:hypothetical protein
MDSRVPPVHVLGARGFGMHPAKNAAENRRALKAILAQAVDDTHVEIRIPSTGTYEIAGDVEVEPEPGTSATIEGSAKPIGDPALRDISLEARQQLRDVGEGIYLTGDGGLEQN